MQNRKLNVTPGAGGLVMVKRNRFDEHVSHCPKCQPELCPTAQSLWRNVCLAAQRQQNGTVVVPS